MSAPANGRQKSAVQSAELGSSPDLAASAHLNVHCAEVP